MMVSVRWDSFFPRKPHPQEHSAPPRLSPLGTPGGCINGGSPVLPDGICEVPNLKKCYLFFALSMWLLRLSLLHVYRARFGDILISTHGHLLLSSTGTISMPAPGSFCGVSSRLWEGLPILSPFLRSSSPAELPSEVPTMDAETLPATGVVIFTLSPTQASLNHVADWYKGCF